MFKKKESQEFLRLSACIVGRPVSLHSSTLSLSRFLPVSPPSHIHKSRTQQLPQPCHPLPSLYFPLLSSLLPLFLSLIRALPKYHEYKSHSPCWCSPSPLLPLLLFLTLSSLPLSILRPLLLALSFLPLLIFLLLVSSQLIE